MTNDDGVVTDEHLLDDEAHDALAFGDLERVGRGTQAGEEGRERIREAQECSAIIGLVGNRLQLGAQLLFALPQRWHALAQLLKRQELFLISGEQPLDTLASPCQFPLQRLFALLGRIGIARCGEPAIEFLLDQRRIFEKPNDLGPDDAIQKILARRSVIAQRAAESPPPIRADAAIVVDLPLICIDPSNFG